MKIGDKVRVTGKAKYFWNSRMDKYIGNIYTIEKRQGFNGRVLSTDSKYIFSVADLELVSSLHITYNYEI